MFHSRTLTFSYLFLFFISGPLYAQQKEQARIDLLVQKLQTAAEDTDKVKMLSSISFTYQNLNPDKGIEYGEQGYALAKKLGWKKGMAMAYNSLGNDYRIKSDYSRALDYFFKALQLNEELHEQKGMAQNYGNIGIVYKTQEDYPKALENYKKALDMFEQIHDKDGIGANLGNIGITYEMIKDYPKALEYENRALKLYEEMGIKKNIAHNLGNIGLVHDDMEEYDTALDYLQQALSINKAMENKKAMSNNYRGLGTVYYHMASAGGAGSSKAIAEAIKHLDNGMAISREIGDLRNMQELHDLLSRVYVLAGNYKNALDNYKQYVSIKDSIFSGKNAEKINGLITKRELDIRDKEIEIRNKQIELDKLAVAKKRNERIFYIAGILVLLVVITAIIKSNRLLLKEKTKSEGLLLNILPFEIARELKEKGSAEARYFDDVTILFTDFVNFTGAGERMGSQDLINELNTCFKEFDHICSKHDIEKIKTIGDAYLAVAGLPAADKQHADKVVKAAIEIRNFMKQRYAELGDKTFEIRIGIHSGSVVAGIVGVKKFAYDIWGDTVNTAARMEQSSLPGKINISQSTYELVKGGYDCEYRGEIDAKNKGMLRMYFLESIVKEAEMV